MAHKVLEAALLADRVVLPSDKPARTIEPLEIDVRRPRHPEDPALP
jgi:ABC-type nitrate/sulfonate/bicarbonate transport system ATPase subunit